MKLSELAEKLTQVDESVNLESQFPKIETIKQVLVRHKEELVKIGFIGDITEDQKEQKC